MAEHPSDQGPGAALQTVAWMQIAPSGETLPVRLMDGIALAAGEQCGYRFRALVYADLAEQRIDQLLARIQELEHQHQPELF